MVEGFKHTEVGLIPDDWITKSIEELSIPNGLVRGPFGGALKKEFFVNSGYKVYEQKNAIYCDVSLGNYYINQSKYIELKRFEISEGDFIISCSGTIGRIYQIPKKFEKGVINQALLKIAFDVENYSDQYFLQYFRWNYFQQRIIDSTQGGAMKNLIGMSDFKQTEIPLPPTKAEQTAIATALNDADNLISTLEKLIAKKKAIKQGAMQELLKPKDGWVEKNLGKSATLKARIGWQGLTTAEYKETGEYFLITGTDFKNGFIDWQNCVYVEKLRYDQDSNIQVKSNDVLVTKDGTIGKVAFINEVPKPATLNSGVFVIRPIGNSFHPKFFYYILLSEHFAKFLGQLSAGSTINHLYQKDFVSFDFWTPKTIDEQRGISEILFDMDSEIEELEQKLAKQKQIKQGMMQVLLTGKIRLV